MKSANKQLQDTLMNYFLENHVGNLLKTAMNLPSKRAVRLEIEKDLPQQGTKYINLMIAFEEKLKFYNCQESYEEMLLKIILENTESDKGSDHWKASVRKKILSLLLYVHWVIPDSKDKF